MTTVETEGDTVEIERLIPMAPDALFAMWADPDQLARWWAPEGYTTSIEAFEPVAHRAWRTHLHGADGRRLSMSGVFQVVEPSRRIAFTWAWEDDQGLRGHETLVDARFEAAPGGTRLRLTQGPFDGAAARNGHDRGWTACFDRILEITA